MGLPRWIQRNQFSFSQGDFSIHGFGWFFFIAESSMMVKNDMRGGAMAKSSLKIFFLISLATLAACSPTDGAVVNPADATSAAETVISALVTQAFATLDVKTEAPVSSPTASMTPVMAATATQLSTPPATQLAPLISVSVNTNCRRGPGQVYDYLGGLMVGETAQVLARDPTGLYWYIRNPDGTGFCWVWGHYATTVGDTNNLPIYTPEPTPTPIPDFTFSYHNLDQCAGLRYVELSVKNTGMVTWESFTLTVRDNTQAIANTYSDNQFADGQGCGALLESVRMAPGETWLIGSMPFMNYNPIGDSFKAELKLCSLDNQAGLCISKEISFTP
jgi:hypothetical protein